MKKYAIASMLLASALSGHCATYHVAPNGNDSNSGLDWNNPLATISNALAKATVAGDTVLVSNGTYNLTTNLMVTCPVTLKSWNGGELDGENTILDGGGVTRCLYITNSGAMVAGFTVRNGSGMGNVNTNYGGGVYIGGGNYLGGVLSNCIVRGNTASRIGGGVYAFGTNALVVDCLIESNEVALTTNYGEGAGGAYLTRGGIISNTTLRFNCATNTSFNNPAGGGGLLLRYNAVAANCHIISNKTARTGGGVLIHGNLSGTDVTGVRMFDCVISGNSQTAGYATDGWGCGGLAIPFVKDVLISGCTIDNNFCEAQTGAGGIYVIHDVSGKDVVISNCVVSNNIAYSGIAAGMGVWHIANGLMVTNRIYNTIFVRNTGSARAGGLLGTFNAVVENCVFKDNVGNHYGGASFLADRDADAGSKLIIRNCLIVSNRVPNAYSWGAAGLSVRSNASIESCTIAGNMGGKYGGFFADRIENISITNTIIYFNTGYPSNLYINGVTSSVPFAYSCTSPTNPLVGPGNIDKDPLFVDRAARDYQLKLDSPCINAGVNLPWMANGVDLNGWKRIYYGITDMGACEFLRRGTVYIFH